MALKTFRVTPCTEVVFVEDDQVPLHFVEPRVLRLDVPCVVSAQEVLERTEINERLLGGDFRRITVGIPREVLPAVEIHMGFEVCLPSILHDGRRLVRVD